MGNQGMKNWKIIALFAVSLMLIAGLLSYTAIARDGSGTASVWWATGGAFGNDILSAEFRGSNELYQYNAAVNTGAGAGAAAAGTLPNPLPAGSTENQLMFSYRVTTNMAGGQVEFSLPTGWTIIKALTDIAEVDEKDDLRDDPHPADDPYDRYENPLVEVYENYGRDAPATLTDASAGFQIVRTVTDVPTLQTAVTVTDDTTTVGTTVGDAADGEGASITRARALNGRVTIGATSVLVDLNNEWRAGGEVVVVLRYVTAAVPRSLSTRDPDSAPYHSYPVTVKSKRSGHLDLLDPVKVDFDGSTDTADDYPPQTVINVGNILGTRTDDSTVDGVHHYGPDTIARDFTITPDVVYEGETDETFRVVFIADGPMYSILTKDLAEKIVVAEGGQASITITIPQELQDRTAEEDDDAVPLSAQNVSVIARGRVLPSGNLSVGLAGDDPVPEVWIAGDNVTINLDRIDENATITLTYHLRGQDTSDEGDEVAGDGVDDAASLIDVSGILADATEDMMVSAFDITTRVPTAAAGAGTPTAATSVTGGKIHSQAGSGTMTMTTPSDNQVEAGDKISTITLVYKAATVLMDVDLAVDVKGIVLKDDDDTENVTEELGGSTYGVVTYRGNFSPSQVIAEAVTPDSAIPSNDTVTIAWEGLNFTKAGQTFTIDIKNVTVREEGGAVEFTTRVSAEGVDIVAPADGVSVDDLAESPKLYITDTQNDAVEFKITSDDADVTDSTFASFHAGQEVSTIVFTFEAVSTAIKGGQVRFTLPSGWTPMKLPPADGKITAVGQLKIEGDSGFQIKADRDKGIKKTPISVSNGGRTLTLGVPELAIHGVVKVTINKAEHKTTEIVSYVTVQSNKTEDEKPEKIDGYFWTSGSRGRGYNAGSVGVEISNVEDGYGNATISHKEVSAGSTDQEIMVDFTAVGSMDGGAVRLVIPDDWGDLQDEGRHRGKLC